MVRRLEITDDEFKYAVKQTRSCLEVLYDKYIKIMSNAFGVKEVPKLDIKLKLLYALEGMLHKDKITANTNYLVETYGCCKKCFNEWVMTRGFILSHEIGHQMHHIVNTEIYKEKEKFLETPDNCLSEIIAESSAMCFFDRLGWLKPNIIDYSFGYRYATIAYKMYQDKKPDFDRFLFFLSRMDASEAEPILKKYERYKDNAYRTEPAIFFGMCVKEED